MKDNQVYERLLEKSWRRRLSAEEERELHTWLLAHPERREDWALEAGLNACLEKLPEAEVPSNFTARVLAACEREEAQPARVEPWWSGIWRAWLPRMALAGIVVLAGVFSYHQVQLSHRRAMVRSVEMISSVTSLPSPEILQDFEAIRALNPAPTADEELIALMQ